MPTGDPGYWSKMLKVNMTTGTWEATDEHMQYNTSFLHGRQMAMRLLWEALKDKPGADPLGPDNVLIIAPGLSSGHAVPGVSRYTAVCKNGLTMNKFTLENPKRALDEHKWGATIGHAEGGGQFAPMLKMAGWDMLYVYGKSSTVKVLKINNDKVELITPPNMYYCEYLGYHGKKEFKNVPFEQLTIPNFEEWWMTDSRFDLRYRSIACGPAAFKGGRATAIISELGRAAGRCGCGVVMASKGLKGVVCFGDQVCPSNNKADLYKWFESTHNTAVTSASADVSGNRLYGTASMLGTATGSRTGHNNSDQWDPFPAGTFPAVVTRFWVRHSTCYNCYVRCMKIGVCQRGPWKGWIAEGPEYESGMSQSNWWMRDIDDYAPLMTMMEDYGWDIIGIGGIIGFVLEAWERGFITNEMLGLDRDGKQLEAKWGDPLDISELIWNISYKDGDLWDWLRGGSTYAGYRIHQAYGTQIDNYPFPSTLTPPVTRGKATKAYYYAMDGKNHSYAAWFYQGSYWTQYIACLRGACHVEGHGAGAVGSAAIRDMNVSCSFGDSGWGGTYTKNNFIRFLLGREYTDAQLGSNNSIAASFGCRTVTLEKVFNLNEGFTREDDWHNIKAYTVPTYCGVAGGSNNATGNPGYYVQNTGAEEDVGTAGTGSGLESSISTSYGGAGWNRLTGIPSNSILTTQSLDSGQTNLRPYVEEIRRKYTMQMAREICYNREIWDFRPYPSQYPAR
ncbi:MAG: hypothetical protein FWE85_00375 [Clostridiales bacterium]|nr:hypothetical protein [Clostridiales bacterium]